jgi:hypothetical protein
VENKLIKPIKENEMENLTVIIPFDKLQTALEKAAEEIFKNSYSNPVKDLLEKCVKDKEGDIKKIIDEIIVESIGNPEFKTKMANLVIQKMVENSLRK